MPKKSRHSARIVAVQSLYDLDFNGKLESTKSAVLFDGRGDSETESLDDELKIYASYLLNGTLEHLEEIDLVISEYSKNRPIDKIDIVDRNILRIGIFELLYDKSTHPSVIIDECVKLSLSLSNDVSYKFINGILDNFRRDQNDSAQR